MWVIHDIPRCMEQIQDNGILLISFQDDVRSGKLISKFKDMSILKIIIPRISRKQHCAEIFSPEKKPIKMPVFQDTGIFI